MLHLPSIPLTLTPAATRNHVSRGQPVRLLRLPVSSAGDSVTLSVNGGYRNELSVKLKASGCGLDYVGSQSDPYAVISDKNHEGHPGWTISDISGSVTTWLAGYQLT